MRLTRETDYGILALIFLGSMPAGSVTGRAEIARQLGIPGTFLAKILAKLGRTGIVRSFSGSRGGYQLVKPPSQVDLARVIEAIDGPIRMVRCIDRQEPACRPFCCCLALEGLARVQAEVTRLLRATMLEDLMPSPENPVRLVMLASEPAGKPFGSMPARRARRQGSISPLRLARGGGP